MKDAALQYAAWGWHVFPLKTRQKTPYETGGFHTATTDPAQIEAWWQRWPKANVGLATGMKSGIFVVDVDEKAGKRGGETWIALCRGQSAIETVECLTPTGGRHLYFSMPANGTVLRNTEGTLGSGVDTRGEGGYVVAPPSILQAGAYEWELSSHPEDIKLRDIPQWLYDLLQPVVPSPTAQHSSESWERWLKKLGDGPDGEGFHGPLLKAAAAYVGQYATGPIDREYLIWKLRQCAERSVWKRERKELQERIDREIPQLVDSALKKYHAPVQKPEPFTMMADELLRQDFPPLRWFATGLLHEGMVLFGGKSKRGKSMIAMNLAISLATCGPAFGHYEVPQAVPVLYAALEDGPRRTQRRLKQLAYEADVSHLKYAFRMPPLEQGGVEFLAEHITEGYRVLIVDVLAHVETGGKNGLRDYHEVYKTFGPLQELRSQHSFALIMITHLRKAESEEVFDNLHGSVAYQGAQDALWVMERKQGENSALIHLRDKDAEDKTVEVQFDGEAIWSFVGEGEEHAANNMEGRVIRFLREENKPCSVKDIMLALDIPASQYGATRKRMFRMASKGIVLRTDRGLFSALATWEDPGEYL